MQSIPLGSQHGGLPLQLASSGSNNNCKGSEKQQLPPLPAFPELSSFSSLNGNNNVCLPPSMSEVGIINFKRENDIQMNGSSSNQSNNNNHNNNGFNNNNSGSNNSNNNHNNNNNNNNVMITSMPFAMHRNVNVTTQQSQFQFPQQQTQQTQQTQQQQQQTQQQQQQRQLNQLQQQLLQQQQAQQQQPNMFFSQNAFLQGSPFQTRSQ